MDATDIAADIHDRSSEDGLGRDGATPEQTPAAERLETALGGDLTRFLLSALAAQPSVRGEPGSG